MESIPLLPSLCLQVSVISLLIAFARTFPGAVDTKVYARVAPLLPIVLCTLGVLALPAWRGLVLGDAMLAGTTLGACAGWAYKAARQSILGADDRLRVPTYKYGQKRRVSPSLIVFGLASTVGVLAPTVQVPLAPLPDPPLVALTATTSSAAGTSSAALLPRLP